MANSYITYNGDGSTRTYSVTFPYLAKTHVKAYIDGVEDTGATWLTSSSIYLSSIPAIDAQVLIKRATPSTPLVDFVDGSNLTEAMLDLANQQALFIGEEARDRANDAISLNTVEDYWDGMGKRFTNLDTPSLGTDAVNKDYVDNGVASGVATAQFYATQAANSATQAEAAVAHFTVSLSDPSGGVDGDIWFKVTI
jgi:hypothetical protein